MPQNEHMELHKKRYGERMDRAERKRKREAREVHKRAEYARSAIGLKGKMFAKKRHQEKALMKKTIAMHEEKDKKHKADDGAPQNALPAYLLEREQVDRAKVLSNTIKQKRKEKAGKWEVPLPKVRPISEIEMFKVLQSGKRQKKSWKRMITKVTFVGPGFTRKPPKYERFIRPTGLRMTKAHTTHPELKATFCLDIIGIKKNPNGTMFTTLGVVTKGTIIEVNVSELGLVTPGGKLNRSSITSDRTGMASHAEARLLQLTAHMLPGQEGGLSRSDTSAACSDGSHGYTVTLPEKLTPEGDWAVRRAATSPYKLVSTFPAPDDHIRTLYDNLEASVARYPHMPYLGTRKKDDKGKLGGYQWMTYAQVGDVRTSIGSGLIQLGIPSKASIGIYAVNCREWVLVDAALHAYNMVSVPLYDTLGADSVEYICNHAELAAVACSAQVLPILMQAIGRCPTVKTLIVFGLTDGRIPEAPAGTNIRIVSLDQVESLGRRHPRAHIPPRPQDVSTLCYTSGTTGVPKGAVLSHNNLIASAAAISLVVTDWMPGDRHICYLPLAHIYERVNLVTGTHLGTAVGFYSGNVAELLDDVLVLKPHIFVSVPRLWNRVYDRVMATIRSGSPITRMLFERAYAYKKACLLAGDATGGRWGAFYDAIIFSKIKAKVGGEVKLMTTGASPISDEVMLFLRICFGATVLEGYGMTESSSVICTTRTDDHTTGHVGAPVPSSEVKLVDIPEMNYTNADKPFPRGEICVRGPGVFMGYYKDEVQTREVLDEDRWLHTGDVGMWIEGGRLKIIDRKKNIFKMAQGEYIAPEKIENVYMRSPLVAQCYVYGHSLKAQLVSIVVPDPEVLLPWAKERNMSQDLGRLMADPAVNAALLKSMLEEGREAKLKGFEQISAVHVIADQFTVENSMLTPTFKIKRNAVQERYQLELDAMYARLPNGMA